VLINPLNTELNPICHLLALLGAHHIFHVSGLRVKILGPKLGEVMGDFRGLHNEELYDLYTSPTIIQVTKLKE